MPDATSSLMQYLQSFGIPKEHATALTYQFLQPVDMKEALTRFYHQGGGEREDAEREAHRVLAMQAYLANYGKSDPTYAAHLKAAAAMIVQPNYVPTTTEGSKDKRALSQPFRLSGRDPEGEANDYRAQRAAEADEAKYVDGSLPVPVYGGTPQRGY